MNLKQIHEQVKLIEAALAPLVERQEQELAGKNINWTFVYEQQYNDMPGWGPNYQTIAAPTIKLAFQTFGFLLETMQLKTRNINYGDFDEMRPEVDRVDAYWKQYHEERRRSNKG